jgi:flagellar basal-body rod modification protein FlgD
MAAPLTASTSGSESNSAGGGSASVTANDFLTLLVTELKNQDPTANQDPNEYINQLVQVNSLQQLISINDLLTGAYGSSTDSSSTSAKTEGVRSSAEAPASHMTNTQPEWTGNQSAASVLQRVSGNLALPGGNASALGIAQALNGNRAS